MASRGFCFLVLGLGPIALTACVQPAPAVADAVSPVPNIGIDLGSSTRVRYVTGLSGEGEGYGRTEPGTTPAAHASMAGMQMDHGAMPGMHHRTAGGLQMAHAGHAHAMGTGTINSINTASRKINVSHTPIPEIGFPAMTMDFAVAPKVDLAAVKPGTRVNFTIEQGDDGMYVIQSIAPAGRGRQ